MADDGGAQPPVRLKPFPPPRGRPAWLRHRTVFRAALGFWLLAIVVRVVRDLAGAAGTASYPGFVAIITVFLGLAVLGGYLAGTFLGLLAGIWYGRVEGLRNLLAGRVRPFAKLREEGAVIMLVIGLLIEASLYWFAFLSLMGLVGGPILVGRLAWEGHAF